jgi:hypothetical protein
LPSPSFCDEKTTVEDLSIYTSRERDMKKKQTKLKYIQVLLLTLCSSQQSSRRDE